MTNIAMHLARELDLPFSVMTSKMGFMGGNGSGKSYTIMKILEGILDAGGWAVVLDPVGIYYGLRLDKSGKKPSGLDIPIFGGLHGDVILTPESGKLIADLICDRRLSAILDVSQFGSDTELNRFAVDFGNQFWNRMKAKRRAVTLVLEECQEFLPQNPSKGEEKKLHIYNRICKIGRNYGVGVAMVSARPQDINKKSLNLTQLMFAFQMTGTHERKAMAEWFNYAGVDVKLGELLPTLEVGEPYIMSPRLLKFNQQVKILPKRTFDASATPDFDESAETIALEPLDITQLEKAMGALIVEAKANDPAELKRKIAKLER
jgi:DNA helicase HerA-like ATPase